MSSLSFEVRSAKNQTTERQCFRNQASARTDCHLSGIYKFLTNGADKVVSELKELVTEIKRAYATATDFVSDIVNLAEKGGRFSRLVADMLGHAFGDDTGPAPRHVDFRVQKYQQSDAILSGLHADGANVLLGNKDGYLWTMDVDPGAVTEQERLANAGITSIAKFDLQF